MDIDVRVYATLTNQLQFVQAIKERSTNLGPLTYQHERFGIFQALGQRIHILHMVVPDFNVMAIKLLETCECTQRIVVIVQYRNLHVQSDGAGRFRLSKPALLKEGKP